MPFDGPFGFGELFQELTQLVEFIVELGLDVSLVKVEVYVKNYRVAKFGWCELLHRNNNFRAAVLVDLGAYWGAGALVQSIYDTITICICRRSRSRERGRNNNRSRLSFGTKGVSLCSRLLCQSRPLFSAARSEYIICLVLCSFGGFKFIRAGFVLPCLPGRSL